jgi:DNA-binding NtrC family response regulator
LNVLPIHLPALRERREDIPFISRHFMKSISKRLNKKEVSINDEIMQRLMQYDWPGNIRELENVIERMINMQSLPVEFTSNRKLSNILARDTEECINLERMEMRLIYKALMKHRGNITSAAKALGVGRNTLYRKISKYRIECAEMEQCAEKEHV